MKRLGGFHIGESEDVLCVPYGPRQIVCPLRPLKDFLIAIPRIGSVASRHLSPEVHVCAL
jgi:hypothetical protein